MKKREKRENNKQPEDKWYSGNEQPQAYFCITSGNKNNKFQGGIRRDREWKEKTTSSTIYLLSQILGCLLS